MGIDLQLKGSGKVEEGGHGLCDASWCDGAASRGEHVRPAAWSEDWGQSQSRSLGSGLSAAGLAPLCLGSSLAGTPGQGADLGHGERLGSGKLWEEGNGQF